MSSRFTRPDCIERVVLAAFRRMLRGERVLNEYLLTQSRIDRSGCGKTLDELVEANVLAREGSGWRGHRYLYRLRVDRPWPFEGGEQMRQAISVALAERDAAMKPPTGPTSGTLPTPVYPLAAAPPSCQ